MGHGFRVGICTDQHLPWPVLRERWQMLEEYGFDSAWVADHLLPWWIDEHHLRHQPVPWDNAGRDDTDYFEGWTLLAALLARTSRIRGGVLVSNNLFRHPALVAKMAATVDHISGGRLDLGLGAGWFEAEHAAHGFDFPSAGERVSRLAEALEIIHRLFREERTTVAGNYYRVSAAPFAPRPVNGHIPIVVGAAGPRMLRLVARYADTWSAEGSPEEVAAKGQLLIDACRAVGRDPGEIRWSLYGYPSVVGGDPFASVDAFRRVVEPYRAVGITEVIFELPDDLDERVLRAIGRDLLPELRGD